MNGLEELLATYPRTRIPLPVEWQRIYERTYKESRGGKTLLYRLTQALESWMHRNVVVPGHTARLLELGAGTLNHIPYESDVDCYDVVEPFRRLYIESPNVRKVRAFYSDVSEIDDLERYDRIVSVAVLEHILDLPLAIALAGMHLNDRGVFASGIPSEGGLLWAVSWRATVGLSARIRLGLDYGDLMRHEHVSTAPEIIAVISYFFRKWRVSRFPLPLHHASLYTCVIASDPIRERCLDYTRRHSKKF